MVIGDGDGDDRDIPMTIIIIIKMIFRPSDHFSTMGQMAAKHRGTILPFLSSALDEL